MMSGPLREADFEADGWRLADGEELHRAAPATFGIPPLDDRERLQPGDLAKLMFRIWIDDEEKPEAVERMRVLVMERVGEQYVGLLDNDPCAIDENDKLWSGVELPFAPRHVIAIEPGDEVTFSRAMAARRTRARSRWESA